MPIQTRHNHTVTHPRTQTHAIIKKTGMGKRGGRQVTKTKIVFRPGKWSPGLQGGPLLACQGAHPKPSPSAGISSPKERDHSYALIPHPPIWWPRKCLGRCEGSCLGLPLTEALGNGCLRGSGTGRKDLGGQERSGPSKAGAQTQWQDRPQSPEREPRISGLPLPRQGPRPPSTYGI